MWPSELIDTPYTPGPWTYDFDHLHVVVVLGGDGTGDLRLELTHRGELGLQR